jgi:hypothetical protein
MTRGLHRLPGASRDDGSRTYTCDSRAFGTAEEARRQQANILEHIKDCLGEGLVEVQREAPPRSHPVLTKMKNSTSCGSITVSEICFLR